MCGSVSSKGVRKGLGPARAHTPTPAPAGFKRLFNGLGKRFKRCLMAWANV